MGKEFKKKSRQKKKNSLSVSPSLAKRPKRWEQGSVKGYSKDYKKEVRGALWASEESIISAF